MDSHDAIYLVLLASAAWIFVHQRRQLRAAAEVRARLVTEHQREISGLQLELEATREELQTRTGGARITEPMAELLTAVGGHLGRALARVSFSDPAARAQVEVYRRPYIPAVVATAGAAARFHGGVKALRPLSGDVAFQAHLAAAVRAAEALVDAVRLTSRI